MEEEEVKYEDGVYVIEDDTSPLNGLMGVIRGEDLEISVDGTFVVRGIVVIFGRMIDSH